MSIGDRYRARVDRKLDRRDAGTVQAEPLRTEQHILHLLLTVFTGGLWGIVWIIRAHRGNLPRTGQGGPPA